MQSSHHTLLARYPLRSNGSRSYERPSVILVPGLCGSRLLHNEHLAWPCTAAPLTSLNVLRWPNEEVTADGVIAEWSIAGLLRFTTGYGRLRDLLIGELGYRLGEDLIEFAYDWRQDCRRSATQLGTVVKAWKQRTPGSDTPIVVLAHSMGGLIARYWIERLGGKNHSPTLVLIGSPVSGTPVAFEWLIQGASFIPLRKVREKLADVARTMPSAYQLLPSDPFVYTTDGEPLDIFRDRSWLPPQYHQLLDSGLAFRAELGHASTVPTVTIVGQGIPTTSRVIVDPNQNDAWGSARFVRSNRGDGLVPATSARLRGSEEHLVTGDHEAILTKACVSRLLGARIETCSHHTGRGARDQSRAAA